jgi:hypothetical protein
MMKRDVMADRVSRVRMTCERKSSHVESSKRLDDFRCPVDDCMMFTDLNLTRREFRSANAMHVHDNSSISLFSLTCEGGAVRW